MQPMGIDVRRTWRRTAGFLEAVEGEASSLYELLLLFIMTKVPGNVSLQCVFWLRLSWDWS